MRSLHPYLKPVIEVPRQEADFISGEMSQKTAFRGGLRGGRASALRGRTRTGVVPGPARDLQYTVWGDKAGQSAG